MANSFALELQLGLRAALVGNSTITGLVSTRVYDEPPSSPVYPYIRMGTITPETSDTDGNLGANVSFVVEVYSQATGRVECSQILEAVRTALHRNESAINLTGFYMIEIISETYSVSRDSGGRGYTGTILFSAILETA